MYTLQYVAKDVQVEEQAASTKTVYTLQCVAETQRRPTKMDRVEGLVRPNSGLQ